MDRPNKPTAKSCILINLVGGPSQLDTFDPKPETRTDYRGPFGVIPTRTPGIYFSELFPKLAASSDRFSLIRSMHHDGPPTHEAGLQLLNSGRLFRDGPEQPGIGSTISYLLRNETGRDHRTGLLPNSRITTGTEISHGQGSAWLQNMRLETSSSVRKPFCTVFQSSCRSALDMVEAGYAFITINMFQTVFDEISWDCHADGGSLSTSLADYQDTVAPLFDRTFTDLLTDLEDRGLLDSTLIVASGEFGRTPRFNGNGGRDHWANCWTALVAGGGTQGGRVIGKSDSIGSEPIDRPVRPEEMAATIFHAMGFSRFTTIPDREGKPMPAYTGMPIPELF